VAGHQAWHARPRTPITGRDLQKEFGFVMGPTSRIGQPAQVGNE
jgi:hypothetical protein